MNAKLSKNPTPAVQATPKTKNLAKACRVVNNTLTTQIAVMPSRHSLAIFMHTCQAFNAKQTTSINITSLLDTCTSKLSSVYGGLIGVNTRPKGNSPSRLFAVVETCQPINGLVSLTKQIGA